MPEMAATPEPTALDPSSIKAPEYDMEGLTQRQQLNQRGDFDPTNVQAGQAGFERPDTTPTSMWQVGSERINSPGYTPERIDAGGFSPEQIQAPKLNMSPTAAAGAGYDAAGFGLDTSNMPELIGINNGTRQRAEDAIYGRRSSRLDPMWGDRENAMKTELYNKGLREGDEAFSRAMRDFNFNRTDAYETAMNEAIMGGGTEMQRDADLARQNRGQVFTERALPAQLGAQTSIANANASAQTSIASAANAMRAQELDWQKQMGAAQIGMEAGKLNNMYGLQGAQLGMEAAKLNNTFGFQGAQMGMDADKFNATMGQNAEQFNARNWLDTQQQNWGKEFGLAGLQAQTSGQNAQLGLQAGLANQQMGLNAEQFNTNRDMSYAQFLEQQRASDLGERYMAGDKNFSNQQNLFALNQNAATTAYNQNMQSAEYAQRLRQQSIAEEQQRRGFSLNEMNAILNGQQVNMPGMPAFQGAQRSEAVQYNQAAQNQYQASMDAYNAKQAQTQSMMGGLTSMAGTAMMFSDRRLKRNVRKIGVLARHGVNLYAYDYIWGEPGVGVMADEVAHIPDAVVRHPSGFDMVNYGVIYG